MNVSKLADRAVVGGVIEASRQCNEALCELLEFLGELDARRLYRDEGYPSMWAYCCNALGMSETQAHRRIRVARVARTVPVVLKALRSGQVHFTGLFLLSGVLTEGNAEAVLAEAAGKTRIDIDALVLRLDPSRASEKRRPSVRVVEAPEDGEIRYRVSFEVNADFLAKLERAKDLVKSRVPSGDPALVLGLALDHLNAAVAKQRFGAKQPRRKVQQSADPGYVHAATRREVVERDSGRCTFVSKAGVRCSSTQVEFHHEHARAKGGGGDTANIRLLCRAHNQLLAERDFGPRT